MITAILSRSCKVRAEACPDRGCRLAPGSQAASMCGIAGFVGGARPDVDVLSRMRESLHHRGPDDGGQIVLELPAGLAMQRLSIIDVEGGHRPMSNGAAWIVFNGEIYDHPEVRQRLEKEGHVFRTRSDTEVVLQAWMHYGPDCLDMLRGMFAFAILDGGTLHLVETQSVSNRSSGPCMTIASGLPRKSRHSSCPVCLADSIENRCTII